MTPSVWKPFPMAGEREYGCTLRMFLVGCLRGALCTRRLDRGGPLPICPRDLCPCFQPTWLTGSCRCGKEEGCDKGGGKKRGERGEERVFNLGGAGEVEPNVLPVKTEMCVRSVIGRCLGLRCTWRWGEVGSLVNGGSPCFQRDVFSVCVRGRCRVEVWEASKRVILSL